jgi:hypothetical protein
LAAVVTSYRVEIVMDDSLVIPSHEMCGVEEFILQKS